MADDKSKKDNRDRHQVAGGQDHEVRYLMEETGVSESQARTLIHRFGNNRAALEREARKLAAS